MVFEAFRKRQKEMLAALVLIAMFVFIAGDLPTRFIYGDRNQGEHRLGTVWGKARARADLERLETERQAAEGALERMVKAADKAGDQMRLLQVFDDEPWRSLPRYGVPWQLAYFAMEGKADRLGIRVSDEDVTQFLTQITGNALNRETFKQSLVAPRRSGQSSSGRGESITEHDLYRVVARELKVRKALEAMSMTADRSVPLTHWRHPYEDARALFTLEMVRVPVDKFLDPKAEPANSELQTIYERYKSVTPDPERNIVGFERPASAEFEYAEIPADKWLDQVQVTDAECKEYYEKNKLIEFRDELPIEAPPPPMGAKSSTTTKEPEKGGPTKSGTTVPQPPPPAKQDQKKAEQPKTETKGKEETKTKTDGKSGSNDKKSSAAPSLRLLESIAATSVYVQATDAKKDDKKGPPVKAEEKKSAGASENKKTDAAKPEEKSTKDKKEPPPIPKGPGDAGESKAGQAKAGEGVPPPKVKPYAVVKPEIERKLKLQKARLLVREKLKTLIDKELAPFAEAVILARRKFEEGGGKDGFVPPKPPKSMEALATEFRGSFHKIGPATEDNVRKMPGFGRLLNAGQKLYDPQTLPFAAEMESDIEENVFYVYWRTNYTKAEAIPFDRVRDQVVVLWRRQHAQKPALEAAEQLAEKVRKSGFAEAVKGTDYRPFQPGAYRRATYHSSGFQSAIRLPYMTRQPNDSLNGVPDAKADFLDQVFEMEEGDVRVLPGDQKENFYVVKCVKREEPSFEEFAGDYDLLTQRPTREQELFMQLQGRTPPSKLALAATARSVLLEESGFTPPPAPARGKGQPQDAGDDSQ